MSNQSRHPAGTSVGGQWAPGAALEVETGIEAGIPIETGDGHDFAGDGVFSGFSVVRNDEDELIASGTIPENFRTAVPDHCRYFDDDEFRDYLEERREVIEGFLAEYYSTETATAEISGEFDGVRFDSPMGDYSEDSPPTEAEVADHMWQKTPATRFFNEMDAGTFGVKNQAGRLRQRLREYDETPLPPAEIDEDDRKAFADGFVSTLVEDQQYRYDDDEQFFGRSADAHLGPEDEAKARRDAERFLTSHSGDLAYMSDSVSWDQMGADAYLGMSGYGVGYSDRVSPTERSSIVAERLHEQTRDPGTEADYEGSVTLDEHGRIYL